MPFTILRQDITKMDVDAIVNSTSAEPSVGGGADRMIHRVAGPDLLIERRRYGTLKVGQAVLTRGFGLPAKYVIHVLGPLYHDGRQGEHARLYDTYKQALKLAKTKQVQSIALPLIGSGTFAFPRGEALETALRAIKAFLDEHDMQVYLVVYDEASYQISLERFVSVESYLERHHEIPMVEYSSFVDERPARIRSTKSKMEHRRPSKELDTVGITIGETFSECLMRLIDEQDRDDVTIYKKANVDRKLFSKIRSQKHYQPSKQTAVAFAIALELDLDETLDLLGKAGFTLSPSLRFDLIIQYFIEQGTYDMIEINQTLFAFDEKTLGCIS